MVMVLFAFMAGIAVISIGFGYTHRSCDTSVTGQYISCAVGIYKLQGAVSGFIMVPQETGGEAVLLNDPLVH